MEAPSPMKGLERLTEELRLERQKSSYALQEKARIRVEIESYKQIIDDQKAQITDFQEKLDTFVRQARDAEQQIHTLSDQDRLSRNEAKQHQTRIQDIEAELAAANEEIDNYKQVLVGRDHEINELRVQYETLQKKTVTKDELIASLKDELLSVRRSQMAFEEEKEAVYARLSEQTAQNEQLRAQLQLVGMSTTIMIRFSVDVYESSVISPPSLLFPLLPQARKKVATPPHLPRMRSYVMPLNRLCSSTRSSPNK